MPKRKANGEGSIYWEASRSRWRAAYTTPDGKRITKRFESKSDANTWLLTERANLANGNYLPRSDYTFGDWLQEYIKVYIAPNVRVKTVVTYLASLKHMAGLANIPLQDLDATTVQRYVNGIEGSQRIHSVRLAKSAMELALDLELVRKNPFASVKLPRQFKTRNIDIFTDDELKKIFSTMQAGHYKSLYAFIKLALATGCRIGELCGLRVEDFTPEAIYVNRTLVLLSGHTLEQPPKSAAGVRRITIPKSIYNLVWESEKLGEKAPSDYIFLSQRDTPRKITRVEYMWKRLLKKAGVEHKTFHCLRHTHATRLLSAAVPILEVSKRLGHAMPSMTLNMYGHSIPGLDQQISDKVSDIFKL